MALTEEKIESLLLTKRRSVLHLYKEDVLRLRAKGVTLSSIKQWLKEEYVIETSCENIRQFCLRHANDSVVRNIDKTTDKSENKKLFENLGKEKL